jgi:hypothetical protein
MRNQTAILLIRLMTKPFPRATWNLPEFDFMDLQHAPKFFWAALSTSMLMLTGGLLLIAYRANSVSIEFADAKVQLAQDKIEVSQAATETKALLEQLQAQNKQLLAAKTELETRIQNLSGGGPGTNSVATAKPQMLYALSNVTLSLPPKKIEEDIQKLDRIQQNILRSQRPLAPLNR